MTVTVYAPASMGNVSVGFDLLGAALAPVDGSRLGDCVSVTHLDDGLTLTVGGAWADKLPAEPRQNIVWQCAEFFLKAQGIKSGVALHLEKNLPVGSGLGSSASSVVAAFAGLNEAFGKPYPPQALLALMGEFEGKISGAVHYDNVAPCYLGGMQLMLEQSGRISEALPSFDNWYWVVAYSGVSLSTARMRQLLPASYDRRTCIDFGRNLAAFVHASYRQDEALALSVLKDVIAEPYRAGAIPGFESARSGLAELGMDVTGISGSGPTLFSVTRDPQLAQRAAEWLREHYVCEPEGFVHVCQLDKQGTRRV
ncbi:homoserine kinase [Shewanella sp. GXUN23E]|uniref:homoserine kinase n=1 Tax=Shewanella sp. GXUN23E TaxID=3422498 RepID=UPI003D7E3D9A